MKDREEVLVDIERIIYAAGGLLEDTIYPMFRGYRLEGLLRDIKEHDLSEEAKEPTNEQAALSWMEDNYDSLGAALYAVSALVEILEP